MFEHYQTYVRRCLTIFCMTMFYRVKPGAHSTIFVTEDEIFIASDENLLYAGNTYKRLVADDGLQYQIC